MNINEVLDAVLPIEKYEEYSDYTYEEQNDLFLEFKKPFDELNKMSESKMLKLFPEYLESAVILAVGGNPVAQDFLVYIYKKGRTGIMQPNLLRAYEWGVISADNFCMLTIDRMRFFFNPAYGRIAGSSKLEAIIKKYDLTADIIEYFFAYNIADLMISASNISLEDMSKKDIIPEDFQDSKIRELENVRDRVIENMLDLLLKE